MVLLLSAAAAVVEDEAFQAGRPAVGVGERDGSDGVNGLLDPNRLEGRPGRGIALPPPAPPAILALNADRLGGLVLWTSLSRSPPSLLLGLARGGGICLTVALLVKPPPPPPAPCEVGLILALGIPLPSTNGLPIALLLSNREVSSLSREVVSCISWSMVAVSLLVTVLVVEGRREGVRGRRDVE